MGRMMTTPAPPRHPRIRQIINRRFTPKALAPYEPHIRKIADEIAAELRSLIDYHNCRVFVVEGDELVPISFLGELTSGRGPEALEVLRIRIGEGITGRCAELGESLLIGDAAKARRALGWAPRVAFTELAAMMVDADLELARRGLESSAAKSLRAR